MGIPRGMLLLVFGYLKGEGMSIPMECLFICLKECLFYRDEKRFTIPFQSTNLKKKKKNSINQNRVASRSD